MPLKPDKLDRGAGLIENELLYYFWPYFPIWDDFRFMFSYEFYPVRAPCSAVECGLYSLFFTSAVECGLYLLALVRGQT
jgi:hypothetical protein